MRAPFRLALLLFMALPLMAGEWSPPAVATARDGKALLTCRARLAGDFLLVEFRVAEGWHVYAMDNERRAKEALAGKMSLGVEQNTEVSVAGGLALAGDWYQTEPKDFSQPELRWYSFGFEGTALAAAKIRRNGERSAKVAVRAQACDSVSCISVESEIELPVMEAATADFSPEGLVRVRNM